MIGGKLRTLSNIIDEAKNLFPIAYFSKKLYHNWQGSNYASDDDCC